MKKAKRKLVWTASGLMLFLGMAILYVILLLPSYGYWLMDGVVMELAVAMLSRVASVPVLNLVPASLLAAALFTIFFVVPFMLFYGAFLLLIVLVRWIRQKRARRGPAPAAEGARVAVRDTRQDTVEIPMAELVREMDKPPVQADVAAPAEAVELAKQPAPAAEHPAPEAPAVIAPAGGDPLDSCQL